jgi:hypothetical protein
MPRFLPKAHPSPSSRECRWSEGDISRFDRFFIRATFAMSTEIQIDFRGY